MIIDGRGHREDLRADICIVGAGPAGITIARRLEASGLRICLLESGGVERESELAPLSAGEIGGLPYFKLSEARARGLGGTSFLWPEIDGLRSRPLDPVDFATRDGVAHSGWPFAGEELDPFYESAHDVAGLGPPDYDPAKWSDPQQTPLLPLEGPVRTAMFRFGKDIGIFRAARSDLERSEAVTVVLHASVVELCRSDEYADRIDLVRVASLDGSRFVVRAKAFVLACGGIENPRLLLLSRDANPSGLGNQHDLVGRFFQEHLRFHTGALFPSDVGLVDRLGFYRRHLVAEHKLTGFLALSGETLSAEGLLNTAIYLRPERQLATSDIYRSMAALRQSSAAWGVGDDPKRRHVFNLLRHPLGTLATAGRALTGRLGPPVVHLSLQTEQAPNPASRVTLGSDKDLFGNPLPRLEWRLTDLDRSSARRTQEILDRELRKQGLGTIVHKLGDEYPPAPVRGFWHHIGTTRMHDSPRQGVVDRDGKVHGVANVYLAGSSVFPTGGYANPTITVLALALRLADHLDKRVSG